MYEILEFSSGECLLLKCSKERTDIKLNQWGKVCKHCKRCRFKGAKIAFKVVHFLRETS